MSKALPRHRAWIGILALGLFMPCAASAQQPAPSLGQKWPNMQDVSRSPHWHVYVFQLNGIKYVEVADLTGRIVSAFGTANHQYITLPVGAYPQYMSTPDEVAQLPSDVVTTTPSTVVYQDDDTTVTVAHTSDGAVATRAAMAGCSNPVECNTNITSPH